MTASDRLRPRRPRGYFLRAAVAVVATAVAAATATAVPQASAVSAEAKPVIFVHGFKGSTKTDWSVMAEEFRDNGYTSLWEFTYSSTKSNRTIAEEFSEAVDYVKSETGAERVGVVTHSMGGLNTRWYLKFLGGTDNVSSWVSLGGPNHGTNWAYGCFYTACFEMRPGSNFLTTLNEGDETPGPVDYGTWWSPCDGIIDPTDSVLLDGAKNTKTECIGHNELPRDEVVAGQVVDFVS
ncbi:alpha/beta fold hydrolase [Haloechinothrix sp. LS1_15]|uniref:esterase/lipase family protein n=1 Tax=Haloechinothrix sp. LS1_15 TaxID=2652248 RepID=UPI0029471FB0|nr:alpha/beta fold hydrolase [Haloechinothrix sp. LS1_15]MDV6012872.1 lipase [Haloechinothrix sp. LS1_15]